MKPDLAATGLALFTATCPGCGPKELRASALHLTVFSTGRNAFFAFFCPSCTEEVRHMADIDTLVVLSRAGVGCTEVHVPDEMSDPARSGPPLTSDDVMDFVVAFRSYDETLWLQP